MDLNTLEQHRHVATTPSGSVSYLDVGEGPAALFVHGVGTNGYLWRHVLGHLAGEHRCIALDLPLHGKTEATLGPDFTLGDLGEVLDQFCAALGLDQVDLVANDTGGAVAQLFAARHPNRIRTLCLTNCDTQDNIPPEAFQPTVDLAVAGQLAPTAPALLEDLASARGVVFDMGLEHPERLELEVVRSFLEPVIGDVERAKQFERLLVAMRPDDLVAAEPQLRELRAPTLMVWGTADIFFDVKWAYWLRDVIPGAKEVVELEGAKLFFPYERDEELATSLRRHWTGTGTPGAA